ncbi:PLP-dependent transferase [Meredithblackwellia eburnea MCA 4105]
MDYNTNTKPDAIDLSHHLSQLSRERMQSPLKGMYKYFTRPGIIMLAGGLPPPEYFPFETLSAQALVPSTYKTSSSSFSWLWNLFGSGAPATTSVSIPKYAEGKDPLALQLSTALQYGMATGIPALSAFIKDFTSMVFQPGYANFQVLINAGSTDAWSKICTMLLERGDGILCEEWTYPSALSAAWPNGFKPVALPMDGGGMTPEGLDELLGNWNEEERGGMKRPRVLYTVPVCQNPTGATMTVERKKKIYALCVKYDVIIVEDDPYYFLQAGDYVPPSARVKPTKTESDEDFIKSLIPSYLKFDYQGRVIRIDTFSKTICPGSRLGWITTSPIFADRMQKANESSTQGASGFAQVLIAKLLVDEWGMTGWFRWLKGLKAQYRDRRDMLVDCLVQESHAGLDARSSTSVKDLYQLSFRDSRRRDEKGFLLGSEEKVEEPKVLLSFVAPQGGMFVWLRVHVSNHPSYPEKSTADLILACWEELAEANVLVAPGTMFSGITFGDDTQAPSACIWGGDAVIPSNEEELRRELVSENNGDGFFRMSFSSATEADMRKAMKIVGEVVEKFFKTKY